MINDKIKCELIDHIIDAINEGRCNDLYVSDLHNEIFNTDYYVTYYSEGSQWLKNMGLDPFMVIDYVQDYEKDNFGETNTKVDSVSIVNMLVYILGEEILSHSKHLQHLQSSWDERLNEENLNTLSKEFEEMRLTLSCIDIIC